MAAEGIQSVLSTRFAEAEGELRKSLDQIQLQVQQLQNGIESDLLRLHESRSEELQDLSANHGGNESNEINGFSGEELADTWLLEDDVQQLPGEEGFGKVLPVGALVLQQTAEIQNGRSQKLNLRLNHHLMELSMKAGEAVGNSGRERWRNALEITRTRSSTKTYSSEFERCESCTIIPPNSKFRIAWDMASAGMILMDAFLLPICLAWNLTLTPFPTPNVATHVGLHVFASVSLVFWPIDIYLSFTTGFFVQGVLQTARSAIAARYLHTWFVFDLGLVAIDVSAGFMMLLEEENQSQEFLQSLRSARYLRLLRTLRILRLLKAGKINLLLENLVISTGRQWLILAFTVGRMLLAIGMIAHIMACIWFGLGKAVTETSDIDSWIELALITNSTGYVQYVHSIGWILLPPAPPTLEPDSGLEHFVSLMLFVTTVLVIGSALSILTGTLQEIRQVNNERSRKRRELRIFLQTKAVPTELLMRIMSYADYKMARQSPIVYDNALISPMLQAELATFQFGSNLTEHPFFSLTASIFPTIFAEFCSALQKRFYSEAESVFSMGSIAEMMYVTSHGEYALGVDEGSKQVVRFSGAHRYFAEVALYAEAVMHVCTLTAESFAEVFVLSSTSLASLLANSPMCTTMFIEYANEYISQYAEATRDLWVSDILDLDIGCAKKACHVNSFYMDMNVDERKILRVIDLTELQDTRALMPMDFMHWILESADKPSPQEILDKLRTAFVELDPTHGLHARFGEMKEQERVESSILSLLALVRNDYEAFAAPQKAEVRMTKSQWQQLQGVLSWAAPQKQSLLAVIWLLAVRPVGKYRPIVRQLPAKHQRPEQAVRYILAAYPDATPLGATLSAEIRTYVTQTLDLQVCFNFAQMLQGENVPANLLQLKDFIRDCGSEEGLQFYVLFLLGFMSGLAGGQGSRFMTRTNANATIPGLSVIKRVLEKDPTKLYWTFLHNRGVQLGRMPRNTADLAVVRFACLCRAQSVKDLEELQKSWSGLERSEQRVLLQHFLADGIENRAVVFEFLPLCLERAKANAFVTIPALLKVLVELVRAVHATYTDSGMILAVDLADLAAFILMVQNSYIFQTCLSRARLRLADNRFSLEVQQENWRRVSLSFASLEAELQTAFGDIRKQVGLAHKAIESDLVRHLEQSHGSVEVPSASPLLAAEVSPLDSWILKDTGITMTMTVSDTPGPKESTMSVGALVLQQTAAALQEGASAQPHFRLNSHLMEISQKAGEAVETVSRRTKHKFGSSSATQMGSLGSHRQRSPTKSLHSEFDKCDSIVVSPNSKFRVGWDFASVTLIILDAFLLPLTMAFDLDVSPFTAEAKGGEVLLQVLAMTSLIFWPLDMVMSFNTGFYRKGALQLKRKDICLHYLKTWFAFDVCVLAVDYTAGFVGNVSKEQGDLLRPLRSARYLRLLRTLRILRIFKAGKVNVIIENLVISMGRQWLILLFTIGRMLMVIGGVTHVLACVFFVVGKAVSEARGLQAVPEAQDLKMGSWIDIAQISLSDPSIQYVHSIGWILLPPAPPQLDPESGLEHVVAVLVFVLTVLVIGSALSILTGTLHEIRQVNNERSRKRRELRIFLQTKAVSTELMMRIMSYADYKMTRHSPIGYDTSLISPVLHAELATFQLGDHLRGHPLYLLTSKIFPQVFAEFCRSLDKTYFSEAESVFIEASLAESMYITSHGAFSVCTELDMANNVCNFVNEHRYFAEVSMYVEAVMHDCTLVAESFAEVFKLSGHKLADILSHSPPCATMFVEYATEFVGRYSSPDVDASAHEILQASEDCAKNASECNSFYLDLYMDDRKAIRYLSLKSLTSKPGRTASPAAFTAKVLNSSIVPSLEELRDAFVELDVESGLHARFSEPKEQERAESAILSLVSLVRDDYTAYILPQRENGRLTRPQWQQLRSILEWAGPTQEKLEAAILLLAIRGIGKFRSLTRQLPPIRRRPEAAVRYILENYSDAMPSSTSLDQNMSTLVMDALELQQEFNFAQMLQGENVAGNLCQLKDFMRTKGGEDMLKFFVLILLGFMSGLAGGTGSRFMTCRNAETTIMGLNTMKHVLNEDPARLYWTYIYHRGLGLSRAPQHSTDLAVIRLACLCRIQSQKDFLGLQRSWDALGTREQQELCKHLLADGITNSAVIFEFLPLCLERANTNPFVTVPCFLEVLVELIQAVRSSEPALQSQMLTVDLADMAAFTLMVRNSFIFQTCLSRAKLNKQDDRFYLEVTQDNWRRVGEPHTDIIMLATSVRDLARSQAKDMRQRLGDDGYCSV
ncbi:Hcn3 [Symbiodinium necroappetens]|uniref:Hcn3 protein n=1 Tax=Symbiodinium necroappetens TaxID=1628268 RepID=A0A812MSX9_9DINO|nr:Hcn3 [Symbiodinium necroappetens]